MSGWQPTDEVPARRYRRVAFLAIVAFVTILVVGFAITALISTGLD